MKDSILESVKKYNRHIQKRVEFINNSKELIDKLEQVFSSDIDNITSEHQAQISNLCFNSSSTSMLIFDDYLLESFKYYTKVLADNILNYTVSFQKLIEDSSYVNKSWHNVIYSMHEEIIRRTYEFERWDLALFEASPKDQIECNFNREIDEIREISLRSDSFYHPLVRYATNRNVIQNTIAKHDIKCYHFACHGKNGTALVLEDNSVSVKLYYHQFLKFFINRSDEVHLVYLNACRSSDFAIQVKNHSIGNTRFISTIGFNADINNEHATEFSISFYDSYLKKENHNTQEVINITKQLFASNSGETEYVNHLEINN
ncbi:MAG: hypothetical protein Q8M70_03200 [bacterium]|nr:hypothetical protein [bacterium]